MKCYQMIVMTVIIAGALCNLTLTITTFNLNVSCAVRPSPARVASTGTGNDPKS